MSGVYTLVMCILKMKQLLFIIIAVQLSFTTFGQTIFSGTHNEFKNIHDWTLRINKDSSINLIYELNKKSFYGEYVGRIKEINDTLFNVSVRLIIGQHIMKAPYTDSITIQMDTTIARQIDKISIRYTNGTSIGISKFNKQWHQYYGISIPNNKLYYNRTKEKNRIFITINRKNNIIDEFLSFGIPFGSAASFSTGVVIEFQLTIKNNYAWTTGELPFELSNFRIKKK